MNINLQAEPTADIRSNYPDLVLGDIEVSGKHVLHLIW